MARASRSGSCYERDRISSRGTGAEQCKKEIENGEAAKRVDANGRLYAARRTASARAGHGKDTSSRPARLRRLIFRKRLPTRWSRATDRSDRHLLLLDLVWPGDMLDRGFRDFRLTWQRLQSHAIDNRDVSPSYSEFQFSTLPRTGDTITTCLSSFPLRNINIKIYRGEKREERKSFSVLRRRYAHVAHAVFLIKDQTCAWNGPFQSQFNCCL